MACAWRNFKIFFSRPLFIIIFWTKILFSGPYSILTGHTIVESLAYQVLIRHVLGKIFSKRIIKTPGLLQTSEYEIFDFKLSEIKTTKFFFNQTKIKVSVSFVILSDMTQFFQFVALFQYIFNSL